MSAILQRTANTVRERIIIAYVLLSWFRSSQAEYQAAQAAQAAGYASGSRTGGAGAGAGSRASTAAVQAGGAAASSAFTAGKISLALVLFFGGFVDSLA